MTLYDERDSHFVKTSGLRWLSLMLLVPIAGTQRVWALPFFTVLAPSQHYHQSQGQPHKALTDWARQMLTQLRRWLPQRAIILVADSSFAVLELIDSIENKARFLWIPAMLSYALICDLVCDLVCDLEGHEEIRLKALLPERKRGWGVAHFCEAVGSSSFVSQSGIVSHRLRNRTEYYEYYANEGMENTCGLQ